MDLVVTPDLSTYTWKDEDEYAHARRVAVISGTENKAIDSARERVIGMIDARRGGVAAATGPFDPRWLEWRPDPTWPTPRLPEQAASEPSRIAI